MTTSGQSQKNVEAATAPLRPTPAATPSPHRPTSLHSGLQAWLQVVSGFMLYFNSWGIVTAFGVFQLYYPSTLLPTTSPSTISWIGTMQGFLLAVTSIFAGCVLDRGHPKILVLLGTVFVVLGLMTTSACRIYWEFMLAQGVCVGIGAGMLFITAVGVIPGWFARRMALATGLAATGSSLGGVIYPIVFHKLEPRVGFGWTLRVIGFIALATCLAAFSLSTQRTLPPPRPKLIDISGFREPLFTLFALVSFTGAMGLYIPFFYITDYTTSTLPSTTPSLSWYMLPILSAGSVVGRTIPALMADRWGSLPVLAVTTAISAVLAFVWIVVKGSVAGLIVWSLLYGAFSGAFVSLQTPTVASITPDMRFVGGRMGMNNFCLALGVLLGNPVAGAIGGNRQWWLGVQVFCGASLAAAAVLSSITWAVKEGRNPLSRKRQINTSDD
ncbi:hypothetical protein M409DRAFT_67114 [Zasmidium cellare ATCC 36951]|uniref:Major facilitator superfamily (MFS) profile domain-containing protein n=1 Tax=Zasmidium cellare ATCC 36951 TaxID=1080233 RepID=A0A6A6CK34_ZASCE|nr:uncharacterized protein M409DRAFT_67114 [Zasmidium cellare ATCC 36951]KAF2165786.1 hypothetical protein M409DRAFT_67114 [Zasmidium cellare ATCC 36951]